MNISNTLIDALRHDMGEFDDWLRKIIDEQIESKFKFFDIDVYLNAEELAILCETLDRYGIGELTLTSDDCTVAMAWDLQRLGWNIGGVIRRTDDTPAFYFTREKH